MTSLRVPYESASFPPGTVGNGSGELTVSWDDVLWAAVTVGRPNFCYVFRHANASQYEARFRWSLVRMALEQSGPRALRFRRTRAAASLDPTEKGAVNYFLGMTFCKLFSARLLGVPWLLHVDSFRPTLNLVLSGGSRPDLVGEELGINRWHSFESKGRGTPPDDTTKKKAKRQATRLISVNGTPCSLHVGAITYFKKDVLHFHWRDPSPGDGKPIVVSVRSADWMHYYGPVVDLIRELQVADHAEGQDVLVDLHDLDMRIGMHHLVSRYLLSEQWELARRAAVDAAQALRQDGFQPDGLFVRAGSTWRQPYS